MLAVCRGIDVFVGRNLKRAAVDRMMVLLKKQFEITGDICTNKSSGSKTFSTVPTLLGTAQEHPVVISLVFEANFCVEKTFTFALSVIRVCALDFDECFGAAAFALVKNGREAEVDELVALVEKNSSDPQRSVDVVLINTVRALPKIPRHYYHRISDISKRVDLLIEIDLLKEAFFVLKNQIKPVDQLKKLEKIAEERKISWLKSMVAQKLGKIGISDEDAKKKTNFVKSEAGNRH